MNYAKAVSDRAGVLLLAVLGYVFKGALFSFSSGNPDQASHTAGHRQKPAQRIRQH